MFKILKYIKKSYLLIFLIICFLILQAMFDLKLPDYTSKIVNIGIQQNGIEYIVPISISKSTYNEILNYLNDDEINYLNSYYELKDNYELKNISDNDKNKLDNILIKPFVMEYLKNTNVIGKENYDISILNNYQDTIIKGMAISSLKNEYEQMDIKISDIQNEYIIKSGIKMLLVAISIMIIAIIIGFLGARLAGNIGRTLREKVFSKVVSFSSLEMKKFGSSSLLTRTTNDIQRIQNIFMFILRTAFYAPIMAIGGVIKTTSKSGSMGWIIFISVMFILLAMILLFTFLLPNFKKLQNLFDKVSAITREILSGIPVIRAFNNEKHEEKRFDDISYTYYKTELFVTRMMALLGPIMSLVMYVTSLAIVYKGAYDVDAGLMQVGDIMAYIQYSMHIVFSFIMMGMMGIMLPRALVSIKRINEVLDTDISIKDSNKKIKFKDKSVEFKDVSFKYPDADIDVITNINFKALKGTTTAIIGSCGSGKSTLINLIPRFYDVTKGSILIDGIDIKDIPLKNLRKKIGYVPQKGNLFKGTIRSNIKFGDSIVKISDNDMQKAAHISQIDDFINDLDDKYDSNVSQGGTNVSGGQRQRISIARALALNPDIYIFDDSFSALDFKTDANLRKELSKITKEKIVFIVAQRISTIMNADQIIVLDEGKIVGIGKHKELLDNCAVYKEIALSQLSEEELYNA